MPTLQEQGGFSKSLAELFGGYLHHGSLWINQKWQNVTFMIVQNLSRSKNNINSFECWKYHDGKPWELCRRQVRITLIHISESGQLKVYLHHFLSTNKMTLTWTHILFPSRWMRGGSLCISPPRRTSHCPRRRRRCWDHPDTSLFSPIELQTTVCGFEPVPYDPCVGVPISHLLTVS